VAPSPIPAPLPPWARTLLQVAPFISQGLQYVLEYIGEAHPSDSPTPTQWRRFQLTFERIGNIVPRDRAATTLDFVKMTSGGADSNWTPGDEDTMRNNVLALGTGWCAHMNPTHHWLDAREYLMQFTPLPVNPDSGYVDHPFEPSGAPIWANTYNLAGSEASGHYQAPQIACTHTDKTAYPMHWGRSYWPFPSGGLISSLNDQFDPTFVDAWGAAIHQMYANLMTAQIFPCTPTTRIQKAYARGLLTTTAVQVDSVPDVVRRRRPSQTSHRFSQGL
jgi:hypothetical protein